jgi:hypothetical protein
MLQKFRQQPVKAAALAVQAVQVQVNPIPLLPKNPMLPQ